MQCVIVYKAIVIRLNIFPENYRIQFKMLLNSIHQI